MIQIVFENPFFVICDKPSGVLSTPSRHEDQDSRFCLGTALQKELKVQIFPVHRLDYEVSGLVMYAKTAESHRVANSWFENKQVQKTYRALTTGQDFSHIPVQVENPRTLIQLEKENCFEWRSRILRGKKRAFVSPQGKDSLTIARFLGLNSLGQQKWDLQPITGRSHQLRFDLSRNGFPILGDQLYGSKSKWISENAIALRSFSIDFKNAPRVEQFSLPERVVCQLQDFE